MSVARQLVRDPAHPLAMLGQLASIDLTTTDLSCPVEGGDPGTHRAQSDPLPLRAADERAERNYDKKGDAETQVNLP